MFIRKMICLLLAMVMVFALAACGKTDGPANPANDNPSNPQDQQSNEEATHADASAGAVSGGEADQALIPGKLCFFNLKDGEQPVLRGVRIAGNRSGSEEFNAKEPADDGIRCIFELNEWVEFYPDTDAESGLQVWVIQHGENQSDYETAQFSEEMPGFVQYCELNEDPDGEQGTAWGSFYLNPDDAGAGYYDFVFTCDGKAVATLLTCFYNEGELEGKSDAELEQLISGLSVQ